MNMARDVTFFNLESNWGAAGAIYCEWYAIFAISTLRANIPLFLSFFTYSLIFSAGPLNVQLSAELWQATAISSGRESFISLYPLPKVWIVNKNQCIYKLTIEKESKFI